MVAITLPDGSVREYDRPVTGLDVASAIGSRLAKDALAIKVDQTLQDLSATIDKDARIEIVVRGHGAALALLRHDCAHVKANFDKTHMCAATLALYREILRAAEDAPRGTERRHPAPSGTPAGP